MKKKNLNTLRLNKNSVSNLQNVLGGKAYLGYSPGSDTVPYDSNAASECIRCQSNIPHGTCNDDSTPIATFTDTSNQAGTMCN